MILSTLLMLSTPMIAADENAIKKAVTLYASFDAKVEADFSKGSPLLSTRFTDAKDKAVFHFQKGFSETTFPIAKNKGLVGGALEPVDVLPNNGRIFYPAKGNMAYKPGGWGGALTMWINTDPNKLLKTTFCDPVQITEKGANNGGIWFDFNNAKPRRDMRMGVFPAVPAGTKGASESDADAPMVKLPGVDFKVGDWHHVVLSWKNFDTGKPDAHASLYLDGKHMGDVKDRAIAMAWDIEKAGIYMAISYLGLMDEFAIFDRPLAVDEIAALHQKPGLLSGLKNKN